MSHPASRCWCRAAEAEDDTRHGNGLMLFCVCCAAFCRVLKTLTLTARFTNLPLVAGAAAEGRLEVVDGLLKDLPFPALAEVNN